MIQKREKRKIQEGANKEKENETAIKKERKEREQNKKK
jgi:hypothetical protein